MYIVYTKNSKSVAPSEIKLNSLSYLKTGPKGSFSVRKQKTTQQQQTRKQALLAAK